MSSRKYYLGCGIGFLISGLNPLYFILLKAIPCEEILFHRSMWTTLTLLAVICLLPALGKGLLRNWRRDFGVLLLSTLCLISNWFSYIWAVSHGFILDASIAYFVSPLITVLMSTMILREKQRRSQWLGFACCLLGVTSYMGYAGHVPTLALVIASSFSSYGLLSKFISVPLMQRLLFEALFGFMIVGSLFHTHCSLDHCAAYSWSTWALIACSGIITALPGFFLVYSAKHLPYSIVGIMNYIVPSTIFVLGVVYFGELISPAKLFMLVCIWLGISIYFRSQLRASRS